MRITEYFQYSKFQKGHNSHKNWRKLTTLELDLWYGKTKSYAKFQLNMSKHVREKCGKLYISSFYVPKWALLLQKLTQIDDNQTWSVVWLNKVICKISAQYIKACMRKVQKIVYFQYSKFRKRHNSYKNWRHSNLIYSTVKQSHMQNFSSICQSM